MLFTRPEHAREIFAGDPEVFHAGKGNAILGPMMGEHSLLLQDSSEHKRARKLLMPAFNGHALREYADLVTEVTHAEVDSWLPGESFSALGRMNRLTLEVILRVVFGVTDESPVSPRCGRGSTRSSTSVRRSCSATACRGCRSSVRGSARRTTPSRSTR